MNVTGKIDFKKTLDWYRARRGKFWIVEVPFRQYLMADGHGDPNVSTQYSMAIDALYPVAYDLKFFSKRELGRDYVVPPLEGLWWAERMEWFTTARDKSRWDWTLMIMTPEWIDQQMFQDAIDRVGHRDRPARLADVRLEAMYEGRCVQTLHVGSYDDEANVLVQLHEFISRNGHRMTGKHHEIYLSDPRRTAADRLRTILRQPFAMAGASKE